jgi:site-specific recombinase XerD
MPVLYSACPSARAAAGLLKRVTLDTHRHSFTTHLLENVTDFCTIQAADIKHLGTEIGVVTVLHTRAPNLHHHPASISWCPAARVV